MGYSCRVVADSVGPSGCRITTMEVSYPLAVHWDFLRHQIFSMYEQVHSVASNRAIPPRVYIERVATEPAEPLRWGKNQPGMVANGEVIGWRLLLGKAAFRLARRVDIACARVLAWLGFHKEIVNWRIMPDAWVTQIVTATDWDNFFALRTHPSARAEMQRIATMMRHALAASTPRKLSVSEWHLPYVTDDERGVMGGDVLRNVSAARCARVSILKHDDARYIEMELDKARKLRGDGHMSPFDHPAEALATPERVGNLRGFQSARKLIPNEDNFAKLVGNHSEP